MSLENLFKLEFILNEKLILIYPGHETVWNYRRFIFLKFVSIYNEPLYKCPRVRIFSYDIMTHVVQNYLRYREDGKQLDLWTSDNYLTYLSEWDPDSLVDVDNMTVHNVDVDKAIVDDVLMDVQQRLEREMYMTDHCAYDIETSQYESQRRFSIRYKIYIIQTVRIFIEISQSFMEFFFKPN